MQPLVRPQDWRLLGVTDVDLYIPILKYVFGEAQIAGPCALVSAYRLRQEFSGLDRDDGLLGQRLLKESVHELGHTLELRHCQDYRCVMASSHAVEWIDLRETTLCNSCQSQVESRLRPGDRWSPSLRLFGLPIRGVIPGEARFSRRRDPAGRWYGALPVLRAISFPPPEQRLRSG